MSHVGTKLLRVVLNYFKDGWEHTYKLHERINFNTEVVVLTTSDWESANDYMYELAEKNPERNYRIEECYFRDAPRPATTITHDHNTSGVYSAYIQTHEDGILHLTVPGNDWDDAWRNLQRYLKSVTTLQHFAKYDGNDWIITPIHTDGAYVIRYNKK